MSQYCNNHKFNITENNDDHSKIDNSFIESQLVSDSIDVILHKSRCQQIKLFSVKVHLMFNMSQSHLNLNKKSF